MSGNMAADNSYSRTDLSTLSNYHAIESQNIHLNWTLDFDRKVIFGSVVHTLKTLENGTTTVDLDTSGLDVQAVLVNTVRAKYSFGEKVASLGSKLSISLPEDLQKAGAVYNVHINYATSPDASAVQWLEPEATKGGQHPYVFTQSQAIHARSMFPCFDSPAVKVPYTASVKAPSWCTVLMSAVEEIGTAHADTSPAPAPPKKGNNKKNGKKGKKKGKHASPSVTRTSSSTEIDDGMHEFLWKQPVKTSAYLVALAAGDMQSIEISPRVKVWAEPGVVDSAAFEFSQTEDFLVAAESLTCPYQWGRYDIVCLPPSFPYGGMENPCLTFATPTLLAGDKSLADVIAHEIAHSWTGNLVTNHTWEHFWLNEGWTVWLERKIMSRVKDSVDVFKLSAQSGWFALKADVSRMASSGIGAFTSLVWPLSGEDPDDAFSRVPYEKGFNLLYYLETIVGTPAFETFAKSYINTFKFTTVTSGEFKDHFIAYFTAEGSEGGAMIDAERAQAVLALDWNALFFTQGMPSPVPNFDNPLADEANALAQAIESFARGSSATMPEVPMFDSWSTGQKLIFMEKLLALTEESDEEDDGSQTDGGPYTEDVLKAIDEKFSFTASGNSEIKFRWQMLCLRSDVDWIVPSVVDFVTSQGRMKFVRPLYRALRASACGGDVAVSTFEEKKGMYHPIARKMVEADMEAFKKALDSMAPSRHPADSHVEEEEEEAGIEENEAAVAAVNVDMTESQIEAKAAAPVPVDVPTESAATQPIEDDSADADIDAGPRRMPVDTSMAAESSDSFNVPPAPPNSYASTPKSSSKISTPLVASPRVASAVSSPLPGSPIMKRKSIEEVSVAPPAVVTTVQGLTTAPSQASQTAPSSAPINTHSAVGTPASTTSESNTSMGSGDYGTPRAAAPSRPIAGKETQRQDMADKDKENSGSNVPMMVGITAAVAVGGILAFILLRKR